MFSQEDERYDRKQQKILAEVPPPPQMPTLTVPAMGSVHPGHSLLHFSEYFIQSLTSAYFNVTENLRK